MSEPQDHVPPSLVGSLLRGATALGVSLAFARTVAFLAQLALGRLLGPEDFGLYAIAISLAAVAQAIRDGGIPLWLMSQGGTSDSIPLKWALRAALTLNLALCAVLASAAAPLGNAYGQSDLTLVIIVIALSLPLGTWASITVAQMQVEMRFELVGSLQAVSAVLRSGSLIILAIAGFGALSFVIPTLIAYAFEGLVGMLFTRSHLRSNVSCRTSAGRILLLTRWSLAISIASAIANQVDVLIVGSLAGISIAGYYFFAYQFAYQLAGLVSEASQRILTPGLRAIRDDPLRYRSGIERAMRWTATVSAPVLLLSATIYGPLCSIVWGERWEPTVWPVIIFTAGLPLHVMVVVGNAALTADGRFRTTASLTMLKALCIAAAAGLAVGYAPSSATMVAAAVAIASGVANLAQVGIALKSVKISPVRLLHLAWFPLTTGWTALAIALFAGSQLRIQDAHITTQLLLSPIIFVLLYLLTMCIRYPRRSRTLASRCVRPMRSNRPS